MSKKRQTIHIYGAGPAGIIAAISAAEQLKNNHATPDNAAVVLHEASDRVGQTILKTGNGRCNFSNANIIEQKGNQFYNNSFVNAVIEYAEKNNTACETNIVLETFKRLGLMWNESVDGMLFPLSNKATSVLEVLLNKLEELQNNNLLIIQTNDKRETLDDNNINIITTGANRNNDSYIQKSLLSNYYYKILGPIKTNTTFIKNLDGIRANVKLSINENNNIVFEQKGEILFRKYGVSGIVVFNASRFINNKVEQCIAIDFIPHMSFEEIKKELNSRLNMHKKASPAQLLSGILVSSISKSLCDACGLRHNQTLEKGKDNTEVITKLAQQIKSFSLNVLGIGQDKQCQVTRGGIRVDNIDPATMKIKNTNTFVAGECVDVDGPCGGYNLHWAWLSGIVAGKSAVDLLSKHSKKQ